jgi:hypothetical protein
MERRQFLEQFSVLTATAAATVLTEPTVARSAEIPDCPPWHTYHTPTKQEYLTKAKRLPKLPTRIGVFQLPDRSLITWDDRGDYEHLIGAIERIKAGHKALVDGVPDGIAEFNALAASPRNGACLNRFDLALRARQGKPGTVTDYDRQLVNAVLPLDSGYYAFLAGHAPEAVAAGVRIEVLEALRDHDDKPLTKDELQHVNFIRAVRDGRVTDTMWDGMLERIGSERGIVEYTLLILVRNARHNFCWAVGVPEMAREDFNKMLVGLKSAPHKAPPENRS